jgi:hypothetical protein
MVVAMANNGYVLQLLFSPAHTAEQRGREPYSGFREVLRTSLTYHIPNVP